MALNQSKAIEVFQMLAGIGYAVSIKHIKGNFYVEVPVTLRGDKAHGAQAEIMALAQRGGFEAVQAGQCLRIA